jgi:hypothetical protein
MYDMKLNELKSGMINQELKPDSSFDSNSKEIESNRIHMGKRGRQCVWKVCSWKLDLTQKKSD